ncbi:MAG TPA: hypothetical protein VFP93_04715 [Gammaproteobacteria bacterium]|nr:hypothetical protein [Gammaproteobacteria bacterium]
MLFFVAEDLRLAVPDALDFALLPFAELLVFFVVPRFAEVFLAELFFAPVLLEAPLVDFFAPVFFVAELLALVADDLALVVDDFFLALAPEDFFAPELLPEDFDLDVLDFFIANLRFLFSCLRTLPALWNFQVKLRIYF